MRVSLLCNVVLLMSAPTAAQTAATLSALQLRPGSWSYAANQGGSEASFVDSSGTAAVSLRCVRANRAIVLSMRGTAATALSVSTSSLSRTVGATHDPVSGRLNATLAATDPLLDALAFSRGRVSFSAAGSSPLVVPAWPEPARAIEDCRN